MGKTQTVTVNAEFGNLTETKLDIWMCNSDGSAKEYESGKAIYRTLEKIYVRGRLTDGNGNGLKGMGICLYIDGNEQNPVPYFTTSGGQIFFGGLMLQKGEFFGEITWYTPPHDPLEHSHIIQCVFYQWNEYLRSDDTEHMLVRQYDSNLNWIFKPPTNVTVNQMYTLEVELKDEFGNPLSGKTVKLKDDSFNETWYQGVTNNNGRWNWKYSWNGAGSWGMFCEFEGDLEYRGCEVK